MSERPEGYALYLATHGTEASHMSLSRRTTLDHVGWAVSSHTMSYRATMGRRATMNHRTVMGRMHCMNGTMGETVRHN